LRGVGGIVVALPFLESAAPRGAIASPPPKRLVIMFTPNGTVKGPMADNWRPSGTLTDFTLSPILAPLESFKSDLNIIDGVDDHASYEGEGDAGHSSGMGTCLTGTELTDIGNQVLLGGGISVDQFLAGQLGATTRLGSLELCVEDHAADVRARMCYADKALPVPPEADPRAAFERVFTPIPQDLLAKRLSVLDAVNDDIKSLSKQLGAADKQLLQEHLTSLRDVEMRLPLQATITCPGATPPPEVDDNDFQTVGKLHMDIIALALQCDMTRIITLQWSVARSQTVFSWLGIGDTHHDISHESLTDPTVVANLTAINTWYATQYAYLLGKLKASGDGQGGTLLDQSAVMWLNEMSIGQDHDRTSIPYVIAGSCGGALQTGRWIDLTAVSPHPMSNQLLLSLCRAMGVNAQTFGKPAYCPGPLTQFHA
jgi:hypothetical protein